MVTLRLAGIFP